MEQLPDLLQSPPLLLPLLTNPLYLDFCFSVNTQSLCAVSFQHSRMGEKSAKLGSTAALCSCRFCLSVFCRCPRFGLIWGFIAGSSVFCGCPQQRSVLVAFPGVCGGILVVEPLCKHSRGQGEVCTVSSIPNPNSVWSCLLGLQRSCAALILLFLFL